MVKLAIELAEAEAHLAELIQKLGSGSEILITRDGQRISAGTFAPDAAGNAAVSAQYPLASDALQMNAVTEEPAGGVPQPTGEVLIAGQPR